MISVDVCDGQKTQCNVPPDHIGKYLAGTTSVCPAPTLGNDAAPEGNDHSPAPRHNGNGAAAGSMHSPLSPASVVWVDVSGPTEEDWAMLTRQFNFHPLAIEDARKQNQRSKVDAYEGYLFVSIRAWSGTQSATDDLTDATREIDIFMGPNFLVTIHEDAVESNAPIHQTRQRWERNPQHVGNQPAYLLYLLLDAVVDEYFPAVDELDNDIDEVETALYEVTTPKDTAENGAPKDDGNGFPNLRPALSLKKRLLLMRQVVAPMRDVLNHLLRIDDPYLIAPELRVFYQDVYDHTLRLVEQVDLHRDILSGVMDAMMALASNRMAETSNRLNQVMKTLTGVSTILMSAALISGIYGMNFKHMPELDWKYGYFMALGSMVLIAVGLSVYFRKIKWF